MKTHTTKNKLIASLVEFYNEHRRAPKKGEAVSTSDFLYPKGQYLNEFGSWNNALIASGLKPNRNSNPASFYEITTCQTHSCSNYYVVGGNRRYCDECSFETKKRECLECGKTHQRYSSPYCGRECRLVNSMKSTKLKDVLGSNGSNIYRAVRDRAVNLYRDTKPSECQRCLYDKHVETCHITPINEFSEESMLWEVNKPDNILFLCPNCHWEFDYGDLTLEEVLECR